MKKLLSDVFRALSIQFVALLLIIGIFALGYYFRRDIQISYHKWVHESSLKSMMKFGSPSTERDFRRIEKYSERRQKHQEALIKLGYLEERIFETKALAVKNSDCQGFLIELCLKKT